MRTLPMSMAICGVVVVASTVARAQVGTGDVPLALEFVEPARVSLWPPGPTHRVVARNLSGKVVVSWGAEVSRRDREARLRPIAAMVVRPRLPNRTPNVHLDGFTVAGPAPEYGVRATFALFEDGAWVGDRGLVRRELAALREEYRAARAIGEVLAAVPDIPSRTHLVEATAQLAPGLALASSPEARRLYKSVLTTLAAAIDPHTRGDRTLAQMVGIARDKVDRRLGSFEGLSFIVADAMRP